MINQTPLGNPQETNAAAAPEQPSSFGQPEAVVPPVANQAEIMDRTAGVVHAGEAAVNSMLEGAANQTVPAEVPGMITSVPENFVAAPAPVEAAAPQQFIAEVPAGLAPQQPVVLEPQPLQQLPPQPGQFQ